MLYCSIIQKQAVKTWIRCFSTQTRTDEIDKNIRTYSKESDSVRPLVLLFSWLLAKGKHLQKYREMYLDEGFDVKTIQVYLFVCVDYFRPINNLSVKQGRVFRGWTSTKLG